MLLICPHYIVVLVNAANQCKGFAKPLKSLTTLLCQTPCPVIVLKQSYLKQICKT